jgi:hypothetical protein
MAAGISTAEGLSLGLTAIGTIATVYFVYSQTQAAKAAAATATTANTASQQAAQKTTTFMRRVGVGRTGLGW